MPKYKTADLAAAREQKAQAESDQRQFLKLEGGTRNFKATRVRIAPPENNMPTWFVAVPMHFNVGVEGKRRTVGCPQKMFNTECPICDAAHFLRESGKEDMAKQLYATTNYLMNTFIVNDEGVIEDETCYIWSVRQGVFGSIWDEFEPNDAGDLTVDLTHIEDGYTLEVKRKGKGKQDTEYKVSCDDESTAFPGGLYLLEGIHDLTAVTTYLTPEQAMAVLSGQHVPMNPALTAGNPWEGQETLPEGTIEGEAKEVPVESEVTEPEPDESPSEDEVAAKAAEAAEAALANKPKKGGKGKGKGKKAEPEPEPDDDEATPDDDPNPALEDLAAFVKSRE